MEEYQSFVCVIVCLRCFKGLVQVYKNTNKLTEQAAVNQQHMCCVC